MDVCDSEGVPHPAIVSEGGRAIVAHHSVLVMEAFSSIEKTAPKLRVTASEKDHKLVGDILDVKQRLKRGNRLESLHDIRQIKEEAQQTFEFGLLDLESKAKIDTIYWQLAQQIVNMHRGLRFIPEEVKQLETTLGDQYICNFSVFQSLLDHWALGQLFPIMPIHRLNTRARSPWNDCRHYVRFRRQDLKVHRFAGCARYDPAAPHCSRRNVLPRRIHGGRVSGHHG